MYLRSADCRGAYWDTDRSAGAHGPHRFFPTDWGEAGTCAGWTDAEANAAAALEQIRAYAREHPVPDGARMEAHPAVLADISRLVVPDRPGEDDTGIGHQLAAYFGVPLTAAPLESGQWRLVAPDGFTCPCCGATSAQPQDTEQGYCGACHWWTGDPVLAPGHLAQPCDARALRRLLWDCAAYGPDLRAAGALCFVAPLGERACDTPHQCRAVVAGQRQRLFRRISELAAEGNEAAVFLAEQITRPDQMFRGDETENP